MAKGVARGLVAAPVREREGPVPVVAGESACGAFGEEVPRLFSGGEIDGAGSRCGGGVNADERGRERSELLFEVSAERRGGRFGGDGAEVEAAHDDEASGVVDGRGAEGVFEEDARVRGVLVALGGEVEVADAAELEEGRRRTFLNREWTLRDANFLEKEFSEVVSRRGEAEEGGRRSEWGNAERFGFRRVCRVQARSYISEWEVGCGVVEKSRRKAAPTFGGQRK